LVYEPSEIRQPLVGVYDALNSPAARIWRTRLTFPLVATINPSKHRALCRLAPCSCHKAVFLASSCPMKTTLEIPDELYRQVKVRAAQENRKMKDMVSEGLRLVLGSTKNTPSQRPHRLAKAPVTIRRSNVIPALSNDAMATLLERVGERLP
jgi:plasmid stability protein